MDYVQREIKFRIWDDISKIMFSSAFTYPNPENKDWILLQHTGLKDKNGQEIYEGDILKYSRNYQEAWGGQIPDDIDSVAFNAGCFYWGNEFLFEYLIDTTNLVGKVDLEIIGNIFQNPELLQNTP